MINGVVVIGASTGGPDALEYLLPNISKDFPFPIIVIQHLPHRFVKTFQKRVNTKCKIDLIEAYDGLIVAPNTIYIVPGGINTELVSNNFKHISFKTSYNTVEIETPSIDKLMISAAKIYQENTLGVILTGMGKDGTEGIKAIKSGGGKTIVQDQDTSAVYGMAKEIVNLNLADEIVPLHGIINKIIEITNKFT